MSKRKIINDPVYGFISFPYEILYDLLDHPYLQRLRRISQLGLSHYVYPGAVHSRLHHAMGSLHLMTMAIATLRDKGVEITEEEALASSVGILLHDIGHGPFSHALERNLVNVSHEFISLELIKRLNQSFDGAFDLAIRIFKNEYHKPFLHELISSQLDMDRMDYLNRDSYYTGVSEGVIGYDRIIKMLNVSEGQLVVEEKGIFSVEKFLMARRLMYWQVYLHKAALSAEQMLLKVFRTAKKLVQEGTQIDVTPDMHYFLKAQWTAEDFRNHREEILDRYVKLDDHDIYYSLKMFQNSDHPILKFYSKAILDRDLMGIKMQDEAFSDQQIAEEKEKLLALSQKTGIDVDDLILVGKESNLSYNTRKETIKIIKKSGEVLPITKCSENLIDTSVIVKHFLCYPKIYT